jgi:2-polyprenyl-6-hydroxyphenyl methylase/3-demethylubiquinone-9 3-methyltransferase
MDPYIYRTAQHADDTHTYLWPALRHEIARRTCAERRAFDLGCGNGSTLQELRRLGFKAIGVDMSESGVALARQNGASAYTGSAYDDLAGRFGQFSLVTSFEVIEHCYDPRAFVRTFLSLIAPRGMGILSTPYHGYWKNLALAVTGKMDAHFTVLWDGGHIKFFSIRTLDELLREQLGPHATVHYRRVGRIPALAKSMIAVIHL